MSFESIRTILQKAEELLDTLENEKEKLDELQQAQIVQTLIKTKVKIVKELQIVEIKLHEKDEHKGLSQQVKKLEKRIQDHAANVDFPKVQAALNHLGEGVSELIKRKESGQNTIKE